MYLAKDGAELKEIAHTEVSLRNPILVGLAVCSHQADASDTVVFSDVSVEAQAPPASKADVLLFLHADTRLPRHADHVVLTGLERSGRAWGRFDVKIEGRSPLLLLVGRLMNLRSRLTGIATGDQAIFVRRDAFQAAGGFAEIPLMEDIALCKRLKRVSRPLCLSERVVTSGRRWEKNGVLNTMVLMWRLRLAYFFGADPNELARQYGYE